MFDAVCWNVWCSVRQCLMQCAEMFDAVCANVLCSVLKCFMQCAQMFGAVCAYVWCSVRKCLMQCAEMFDAVCWNVWCSVRKCLMQCAQMFDAVCANVWCSVLKCLMQCAQNRETHVKRHVCLFSYIKCETKRGHKYSEHKVRQRKGKIHPPRHCTNINTVCLSRERPLQISQYKTFLAVFPHTKCDWFRWIFRCCFSLNVLLIFQRKGNIVP